jgi:hypothetical protein
VYVTLSKGATAVLRRPEGFDGTWHVRASWRASADEDWFGSWNHGTDEDALRLEALRPAEWRFELRRDAAADGPALVRFAILTAGQVLSIE